MTSTDRPAETLPAETLPDVTTAVQRLLPDMRRKSLEGWLFIGLVSVAAIGVSIVAVGSAGESDSWKWAGIALGLGLALVLYIANRTRRAHEAAVMPILATTVGLAYQKDAKGFAKDLPARLLPDKGLRTGEDLLSGTLGGRMIRLAEIKVETGGKNSRTLFKGVVANFPNVVRMPPFFVAEEGNTGRSLWFGKRLDVDGLVQVRTVTGGAGRRFGVWASSPTAADNPGLGAVLDILTDLEHHVGGGTQLFSASSDGQEMHVALTHKHDLYRIGGLFVDRAALLNDVQAAYRDLQVPLVIATRLMEAERHVAEGLNKR